SYLQAQFAVLTAHARAGDANAAQQLPAIVQALEEAIKGSAGSASEVRSAQIAMASSLQETQAALDAVLKRAAQFDPDSRAPAERAQSAPGDVRVTPPPRVLDQAGHSPALLAEVQLLRKELKAAVEAGFGANVRQVKRAADVLEKFAREGLEVH
ncbi:MAG: hypothetical protein Q4A97_08495, partial [Comamonadaceae bacterium]|nr:hypothetical protein [Comamonadaceae bacterium]